MCLYKIFLEFFVQTCNLTTMTMNRKPRLSKFDKFKRLRLPYTLHRMNDNGCTISKMVPDIDIVTIDY